LLKTRWDLSLSKISEPEALEQMRKKVAERKEVEVADLRRLTSVFGQRFKRAWKAIQDQRVKRYLFKPSNRIVWVVVGKRQDYLIMPAADFCNCDDFYFRVMDKQIHMCYHLIAQKLAETLGKYDRYEEEDALYDILMNEWKKAIV
jgi:predicted nucleic acid-binding Zn finger protein